MQLPPLLKKGDTIGVMAPSSYVEKEDIEKSKALLEERGYKVFIHPQTYERYNQSAGTHLQKSLAFQGLWQREDIKAIWTAGGGNRALALLEIINFEKLKNKPKVLIGFSDVTALINAVYVHTGIPTYHGPVFKNLYKYRQMDHLLDLLSGKKPDYPFKEIDVIREGKAEGRLIGGNLSVFQCLPNVLPGKFWEGALLFLEDCSDEISRFDRMFCHLKQLGIFKRISGLIIGQFHDVKDTKRPYGFTLKDIIEEHTEGLDIPVVINAPFGHGKVLHTLPIGLHAFLDAQKKTLKLT